MRHSMAVDQVIAARIASVRRFGASRRRFEFAGFALLAYVPFFASSPGQVSGDTKAYLTLDPGRLLERAPYLWDPHIGMGTVPHQNVGYLFPMGPYFWLMDQIGMPDWVAQRIWLGTISLAAVLGARWLFTLLGVRRVGAIVGALVYMLTPYQLAFSARTSVLLLPWAGLPWLVGLTIRATRRVGWRDPVLFALVVLAVGGTNATALMLVCTAPALWLLLMLLGGRASARVAGSAAWRILVPTVGISVWWAVALRTQGAYGLPVLQLTENLRVVSLASLPNDLLRGLGNWFFYGGDRLGYSIDQVSAYANERIVIALSFGVPIMALVAAGVLRWRYRAYFAILIVVGTIVSVGAWPYDNPSIFGRAFKSFANDSSLGLAFRNTPRVAPIVVLGVAALVAAGISALARRKVQLIAAGAVVVVAIGAFAPVWRHGYLSERNQRDEKIPSYWIDAAAALDRGGDTTRVLEIPGSNFAAYRWGNNVDPLTPGITDRPWVGREVLPFGSPASVNLLVALDHRIQEGTFEPGSLAAVARLMNAGVVLIRSDLEYERFDGPRPRLLWAQLTRSSQEGLRGPLKFGPANPNRAVDGLPMIDELELRTPTDAEDPPEVALLEVRDPVPIIHAAPSAQAVLLAGDGEGIVDAAAAGLLNGDELILQLASLSDAELRQALRAGAALVLTDTNRRRAQTWFASLRDATGATERAGQRPLVEDLRDFRLEMFHDAGDDTRTVIEHRGGTADATSYGDIDRYTPEDRPVNAVDGDLFTAWRAGGGAQPTGERLVLRPDQPVRTDHIDLVQPLFGDHSRWLTQVRLHFDRGPSVTVELGPGSLTPKGQRVEFPTRTIRRLEIEPLTTNTGTAPDPRGANPVGFAEVRIGDVRVTEIVRLPVDLARRVGADVRDHSLAIVLTRLRIEPGDRERHDEELALSRRFVLGDARSFDLSGTARVNPNAYDDVLDLVLGTTAEGATFRASGHLAGDAEARASRAFDGDLATAWTAPMGTQEGQWVEVDLPSQQRIDRLELTVIADEHHSVPTTLGLEADGQRVQTLTVPPVASGPIGTRETVPLSFDPVTARQLRLVVDAVQPATTIDDRKGTLDALPVAISEVAITGVRIPVTAGPSDECRSDLVRVDGDAVPVRVRGTAATARDGWVVEACEGALDLSVGSHVLKSASGAANGIDIDRLVLTSGRGGSASAVAPLGATLGSSGATVRVVDSAATSFDLKVRTDGTPFWLVLGQSNSSGWEATTANGRDLSAPTLVDGHANGWLVDPGSARTMSIQLRWTPQRLVWVGLALSIVAALACLAVVFVTRRRRVAVALGDSPMLVSPWRFDFAAPSLPAAVAVALVAGAGAAVVSRWWIGLLTAAATAAALRLSHGRIVLTAAIPLALAASKVFSAPELGWLAVVLLGADVLCACEALRRRFDARAESSGD
ncbi:MAG: DUF3367 domain-containing protein [Acidimicrobiia bacterium]|nr:DUF3367 domain-containing protein [Acidimicrobiia bacterium]